MSWNKGIVIFHHVIINTFVFGSFQLLSNFLSPVTDQVSERISDYSNSLSSRAHIKSCITTPFQVKLQPLNDGISSCSFSFSFCHFFMNPSWCLSPDRHSCRAVFRIQFFLRPPGSGRFRGGCPAASDLEGGPLPPPETETKRLRRGGRTAGGSRRPEEIQAWWAHNQWEFVKLKQSFVLLTDWQSLFRANRGVYFFISGRPGPNRSGMFSVYEVRFKE